MRYVISLAVIFFYAISLSGQKVYLKGGYTISTSHGLYKGKEFYKENNIVHWLNTGIGVTLFPHKKFSHYLELNYRRLGGRALFTPLSHPFVDYTTGPDAPHLWVRQGYFVDNAGLSYQVGYAILEELNFKIGLGVDYSFRKVETLDIYPFDKVLSYESKIFDQSKPFIVDDLRDVNWLITYGVDWSFHRYFGIEFNLFHSFLPLNNTKSVIDENLFISAAQFNLIIFL